MPAKSSETRKFRAVLEQSSRALGWTIARLPFDPIEIWPDMVRRRLTGEINGAAFRTSLFADTQGDFLLVNHEMQRGAGVSLGDSAAFALWPDRQPRPAELPDELSVLLDNAAGLRKWYEDLSESTRREIGKWVVAPKSEEVRRRRAGQMAERLLATMEAERELPPQIQAAFRARPGARAGWRQMTETQRRNQLLGVFYYQTPHARERRIDKFCDEAEKHASQA